MIASLSAHNSMRWQSSPQLLVADAMGFAFETETWHANGFAVTKVCKHATHAAEKWAMRRKHPADGPKGAVSRLPAWSDPTSLSHFFFAVRLIAYPL